MLVALDQSSSVVVQLYCLSLLLCGEFFFSRYACLSSGLVVTSIFTDDWKFSSKGQIKDLILV